MNNRTKKMLSTLEVELKGSGFCLWVTETMKDGSKCKHWVLDGTCVKDDGVIHLGRLDLYRYNAHYEEISDFDHNIIQLRASNKKKK